MPPNNPQNLIDSFNVGQDVTLTIKADTGEIIPSDILGHLVHFSYDGDDTLIKVKRINRGGTPLNDRTPQGYQGQLGFARMNGNLDDFLLTIDNNFFDAGHRHKFSMQVGIANRDGSVDQYLCTGVIFHKHKHGDFKSDKEVEQGMSFDAQRIRKTSSNGGTGGLNQISGF